MSGPNAARQVHAACRAAAFGLAIFLAGNAALAQPKGDPGRGETKAKACAACHGPAGRAPLPGMPSLAAQPELFLVLQMILLREGLRDVPQMTPLMKGLPDRDLTDIAAYFAGQTPAKHGAGRDPALYELGAGLAKAMGCGSCHRADFTGQRQMPRLAGQREDYLLDSMKAYRDDRRSGTDTSMNGVLYRVGDSELRALAHYLAHQ